jgi:hypothetical protein
MLDEGGRKSISTAYRYGGPFLIPLISVNPSVLIRHEVSRAMTRDVGDHGDKRALRAPPPYCSNFGNSDNYGNLPLAFFLRLASSFLRSSA